MLLNDRRITQLAQKGMITPFFPYLVREIEERSVLSYGLSSFGYDLRLSPQDFRIFRHIPGTVVDPKRFNPENLERPTLHQDGEDVFFILPAHTYALGVVMEHLDLPRNVTAIFVGKSTMARVGVIANVTPGEAGWRGHLTVELSNSSCADVRVYANEGIVQTLFLEGEPCLNSYSDRQGKYQDQPQQVTIARV